MSANFEFNQSRRSERVRLPAEVLIDGQTYAVHDWSFHGFSTFSSSWCPAIGTHLRPIFILPFDSFKAQVEITAQVRSVQNGIVGLEFVDLPHAARVLMREYVEEFVHGKIGAKRTEIPDARFIEMPPSNAPSMHGDVAGLAPQPAPPREFLRLLPKLAGYLMLSAVLIVVCAAVLMARRYVDSATAVIAGNAVELRAQAAGVVSDIAVKPGQPVRAGETILRLDDTVIQSQLKDLEAVQARREALLELNRNVARDELKRTQVYTQVAGSRMEVESHKVEESYAAWQQARAELTRSEELVRAGFKSQAGLDEQRAIEQQRHAAWEQAREQQKLSGSLVDEARQGRFFSTDKVPNRYLEAMRDIAAEELALEQDRISYANLTYAQAQRHVVVPVAGKVRMVSRSRGESVKVGDTLAVVDTADKPWVVASFDAIDAQSMHPGQLARIYSRISEAVFEGRVESVGVMGGEGGASSMSQADKVAGEVEVRISLNNPSNPPVAGTRLEVEVDTGRSLLAWAREWLNFRLR